MGNTATGTNSSGKSVHSTDRHSIAANFAAARNSSLGVVYIWLAVFLNASRAEARSNKIMYPAAGIGDPQPVKLRKSWS